MDGRNDPIATTTLTQKTVTSNKLNKSISADSICSQSGGGGGSGVNGGGGGVGVSLRLMAPKKVRDLESNRLKHSETMPSIDMKLNRKSNGSMCADLKDLPPPLSLMQKLLLDEQSIYSDPNDNYKRRTIVLIRPKSNGIVSGEFGFNLQAYGFVNKVTGDKEYICFIREVEARSPAKKAGLNSGDVILAIDGVSINQFRSFAEISQHVKGKNELRMVVMAENVSKRIQCQLKAEQIRRILADKRAQLEKVNDQAEELMRKYGIVLTSRMFGSESNKAPSDALSLTNSTTSSLSSNTTANSSSTSHDNTNNKTPGPPLMPSNNESTIFMSPLTNNNSLLSSSDVASEDVSLSQSSSFSSSHLKQNNNNNHKALKLKSSTPVVVESSSSSSTSSSSNHHQQQSAPQGTKKNTNDLQSSPPSSTVDVGDIGEDDKAAAEEEASLRRESTQSDETSGGNKKVVNLDRSFSGSYIVKMVNGDITDNNKNNKDNKDKEKRPTSSRTQPQQAQKTTTAYTTNNSNNNNNNKSSSFARKYFESTSRLVRSASSSSMNLFSNLKSNLSSNNLNKVITQPPDSPTKPINYSPSLSLAHNNNNNNDTSLSKLPYPRDRPPMVRQSISSDSSTTRSSNLLEQMLNPSSKKSSKLMMAKKATIINDASDSSSSSSTQITFDTNPNTRNSTQYSSDRVVKLNNHYEKSSLQHPQQPLAAIKPLVKNQREFKKNIFSILSNKPKFQSRRYELNKTPPLQQQQPQTAMDLSNSSSLMISVLRDSTASSATTDSCESSSDLLTTSRIRSTPPPSNTSGSSADISKTTPSMLNRSISCDFGASPQLYSTTIPVIDYTNQDYVITRL